MDTLIDTYGEGQLMLATGVLVGLLFGAAAAWSRFCLRAATAEVSEGQLGPKLAIWLVAFCAALFCVQTAIAAGVLDVSASRQLASTGSLSGAVIGGLMFGVGMILARGCASRLLVLSASGNLRAIITGLVLTLVAQASLTGVLAPAREGLANLWTVQGGEGRHLLPDALAGHPWVAGVCAALFGGAMFFGLKRDVSIATLIAAALVGVAVYAGWQMTWLIAASSFEIVAVQSVTFTGPSTNTLMSLINARSMPATFGMGLVPGVFLGAMVVALLRGEARIQRFEADIPMERYLIGGALMGFGSMLAGGCAVGAGMTGGAILAVTAWLAVFCMWIAAMATQRVMARSGARHLA